MTLLLALNLTRLKIKENKETKAKKNIKILRKLTYKQKNNFLIKKRVFLLISVNIIGGKSFQRDHSFNTFAKYIPIYATVNFLHVSINCSPYERFFIIFITFFIFWYFYWTKMLVKKHWKYLFFLKKGLTKIKHFKSISTH